MNLLSQEFSMLHNAPSQTIADKTGKALALFTEGANIPFQNETTTTMEPECSMKTRTVETQTGLLTRAVALTTLATENHIFFRDRDLYEAEGFEQAEMAVQGLYQYIQESGGSFAELVYRNGAFLEGEVERTHEELDSLKSAFCETELPEEKARIEGRINLTNLRILNLQRISRENHRILQFFEKIGSEKSRK
jgi:hypothetical protein